jgi:hypothetical protein
MQERNAAKKDSIKPRRFFPIVRGIPLWFFYFWMIQCRRCRYEDGHKKRGGEATYGGGRGHVAVVAGF